MLSDMHAWQDFRPPAYQIIQYVANPLLCSSYPSETTVPFLSAEEKTRLHIQMVCKQPISERNPSPAAMLGGAIQDLGISKSFAARILGVSRPTLYAWLEGTSERPHEDNLRRIEWLCAVSDGLDGDIKPYFSFYKHRRLGPERKPLEDILAEGNVAPHQINSWLRDSITSLKELSAIGAWKKDKKSGSLYDEMISDMPLDVG